MSTLNIFDELRYFAESGYFAGDKCRPVEQIKDFGLDFDLTWVLIKISFIVIAIIMLVDLIGSVIYSSTTSP